MTDDSTFDNDSLEISHSPKFSPPGDRVRFHAHVDGVDVYVDTLRSFIPPDPCPILLVGENRLTYNARHSQWYNRSTTFFEARNSTIHISYGLWRYLKTLSQLLP